jgi:hypothetical protein
MTTETKKPPPSRGLSQGRSVPIAIAADAVRVAWEGTSCRGAGDSFAGLASGIRRARQMVIGRGGG